MASQGAMIITHSRIRTALFLDAKKTMVTLLHHCTYGKQTKKKKNREGPEFMRVDTESPFIATLPVPDPFTPGRMSHGFRQRDRGGDRVYSWINCFCLELIWVILPSVPAFYPACERTRCHSSFSDDQKGHCHSHHCHLRVSPPPPEIEHAKGGIGKRYRGRSILSFSPLTRTTGQK